MTAPLRINFLGLGTVGLAAYRLLDEQGDRLSVLAGGPLQVGRVVVRDASKPRAIPSAQVTIDHNAALENCEILVEVMGGREPAFALMIKALGKGIGVVTANKEIVSRKLPEFLATAEKGSAPFEFEAAVGGGVPVIRALRNQLGASQPQWLFGIVNGTTNYIFDRMAKGATFRGALAEAQKLGFAEADPTADIDGFDAQSKLAILASLFFGRYISPDEVGRQGLSDYAPGFLEEFRFTHSIRYVGHASLVGSKLQAAVHPTLVSQTGHNAMVQGVGNRLVVSGDRVGMVSLTGKGAGGDPTAASVVGDIVEVARQIRSGGKPNLLKLGKERTTSTFESFACKHIIGLSEVSDPKRITLAATECKVGVEKMERVVGQGNRFNIETELAAESNVQTFLNVLDGLAKISGHIRMVDEEQVQMNYETQNKSHD